MSFSALETLVKKNNTNLYRVARGAGVPPTTLYDWKAGEYTPKIDKLEKLAKYFGVQLDYFLKKGE